MNIKHVLSAKHLDGLLTSGGDVSESRTIRRIFGIKKPDMDESGIGLFADWSYSRYTERTWKVIKLFTSDIGPYLTRDEWLKKAYNVLGEFK